MTDKQNITEKVQKQFGDNARNYVTSNVHATGEEFGIFLDMAQPTSESVMLDIATGGGHTALKFAPHVKKVIATDLTPKMLEAAREFITPQADNVAFEIADAENLPFEDAIFDIVTCRIAPHHFSDIFKFVLESSRVLKPGGVLIIQDHVAPNTERDAEYLDAFEKLRDPSHVKTYSELEWRGTYLDAGLTVEKVVHIGRADKLIPWAERMNCSSETIERLTIMMAQAPEPAKKWSNPKAIGTPEATITHRYIIISGRKNV